MVTIEEAFSILKNALPNPKVAQVVLEKASKHILAEDLYAPISMPPFRQSAMDGFALGLYEGVEYEIVGEIKAGDAHQVELQAGQAVKIFTGAPVPDSASAVIQIEKVTVNGTKLQLEAPPKQGVNIRPIGEQNLKGELILEKGTLLNAACIGFLAGLGLTHVQVYQKPSVGILVTGNELVAPGLPLSYGKIYESNSVMLAIALQESFFGNATIYKVDDDFENTKIKIAQALDENEVILISGGISVGDYDFVAKALEALEVETLFYKVKQKPGKPLFAGKYNDKMVFALPGNPAASLTCFYVYVLPSLKIISGFTTDFGQTVSKKLTHNFTVSNARNQFLKGYIQGDEVTVLSHQNSSMLNTFSISNGLVYVEDGGYELAKGDVVEVFVI
ncbi:molybdopterin molybdotransferase MoeA [Flavobacterium sp. UMI-01]|uniref:molybdopterin molybdotransferase MoeA n=1 Tax=Flavobacterium sp. UMI-01 TaxID=1441053 RepID=UPI001C7DA90D|nr:molybdopterin molybdotransferase MoeA [Flavobacterium sp. UMI-01]GIZ07542.1 molybdopterin molybdenumtransferase MoeA [Flavobacterium sp. UMI-01]